MRVCVNVRFACMLVQINARIPYPIPRSLIDIANEKIEESNVERLVEHVFSEAGFESKDALSVEDFNRLLGDYGNELNYASLDFDGRTRVVVFLIHMLNSIVKKVRMFTSVHRMGVQTWVEWACRHGRCQAGVRVYMYVELVIS